MITGYLSKIRSKLFSTEAPLAVSLLRVVIGWIFVQEGLGKLLGWFGGGGLEATSAYFGGLGIPFAEFCAHLVAYSESLCGVAFIFGFMVRPAAIIIGIIMAVAIVTAHRQGGFNFPLLLLAACIVFLQVGAGVISLDRLLTRRKG